MKQKLFQTELGTEKYCTCCGELYPVHRDFFIKTAKIQKAISVLLLNAKIAISPTINQSGENQHERTPNYF